VESGRRRVPRVEHIGRMPRSSVSRIHARTRFRIAALLEELTDIVRMPLSVAIESLSWKSIWALSFLCERRAVSSRPKHKANIANSGFDTVFAVVDGADRPVCDYAGFAPFGFGYRRCPGEQLTIQVFEDFLRKVWRDKIAFRRLNLANPGRVPIGPNTVIQDDIGFVRST
jgi:hypothetical protein